MAAAIKSQNSHLTAKERTKLSFPANYLRKQGLLKGSILDFGCGFGKDVELLKQLNYSVVGYDPYYFSFLPDSTYDTIICIYVLNVLSLEEQANVLMDVSRYLKPGGKAYFAVRRDIKYEGLRMHALHKKQTYQCNVVLNYKSLFKSEHCEIYEYSHWNYSDKNNIINCPFCNLSMDQRIIVESATVFAVYDKFPVSNGHALIIPKNHCANYFDLSFKEQSACWYVVNKVKQIVMENFRPDGFNIGININQVSGQTVLHSHIHLIPRYENDVKNPEGGVRGVVPHKRKYRR